MTFNVDLNLTIEIYNYVKSCGGKITVFKELKLFDCPKENEEDEQEYNLHSQLYPMEWDSGWNFAECGADENPIPLIVQENHEAGEGMIHCWLKRQKTTNIPFEARLEDFHFAGYAGDLSLMPTGHCMLAETPYTQVHMGFKKLYLYKVDKELGTKLMLEDRDFDMCEVARLFNLRSASRAALQGPFLQQQQAPFLQQQQAPPCNMFGGLAEGLLSAFSFGSPPLVQNPGPPPGPLTATGLFTVKQQQLAQNLGGLTSGGGKQATPDINFVDPSTIGSTEKRSIARVIRGTQKLLAQTRRALKSDNNKTE